MTSESVSGPKSSDNWKVFDENGQENMEAKIPAKLPATTKNMVNHRVPFQLLTKNNLKIDSKIKEIDQLQKSNINQKNAVKKEVSSKLEEKIVQPKVEVTIDQLKLEVKVDKPKVEVKVDKPRDEPVIEQTKLQPKLDKPVVEDKSVQAEKQEKTVQPKVEEKTIQPKVEAKIDQPMVEVKTDQTKKETKTIEIKEEIKTDSAKEETKADQPKQDAQDSQKENKQINPADSKTDDIVVDVQPLTDIERSLFYDYFEEIQIYLMKLQATVHPVSRFVKKTEESKMRCILIDWMAEVVEEYQMTNETFFLAVSMVYRYLSIMPVEKSKLQLLGTSALFTASKYEEIFPPPIDEFAYITDNSYEKDQIVSMERDILKVLGFLISVPTPHYFLTRHIVVLDMGYPQTISVMAEYLCHLSTLCCEFYANFYPNDIAVCSLIVAVNIYGLSLALNKETRNQFFPGQTVEEYKNHPKTLQACTDGLCSIRKATWKHNKELSPGDQQAIFRIFSDEKKFSVALFNVNLESPKLKF